MVMHYLYVLLSCSRVSLVLYFALFNMFLFCFSKKKKKSEKYKNNVCFVYIGICVPGWSLKQNFLNFVSFVA